ncbi:thioredoxin family protein [Modicisalibacter tunisiensis]|uniref:Thioredoxin n=1 Tax=Modicisalibacter tunisiensis TaxID=390637 RepID=A0ABS7X0C9_9GAMM|nr:thioredoxin family protein [Modicisalibacter tunisiensis]MBZ9567457.1 thioredoxin family protein [Modicisalibacter tunisiensis]
MAETTFETLSGDMLEARLAAHETLLVAFVADWCEPCAVLLPRLARALERQPVPLATYQVEVDAAPELARKYGVRGMPTSILFVDGDLVATRVGALDDDQLRQLLDSARER